MVISWENMVIMIFSPTKYGDFMGKYGDFMRKYGDYDIFHLQNMVI